MSRNSVAFSDHETVKPVRPVAPYVGGKARLAKRLTAEIERVPHKLYAEPFVGMGGVFLRRQRRPQCEAINDLSGDVSTFYRILQRHYVAFLDMLRFQITSRAEFERLKRTDPTTLTDLERAARFLYLQRTTYGGLREGVFGVRPLRSGTIDITRLQPLLEEFHERLAPVVLESLPFDDFMRRYDREETFFFIDPPYYGVEGLYGKELFCRDDYETLLARLRSLKGKFLLTINDRPETREIFADFAIEPVKLRYTVSHTVGEELLVSNFSLAANDT
jgi:DNA adenine methylase